jgi:hypothetical protein
VFFTNYCTGGTLPEARVRAQRYIIIKKNGQRMTLQRDRSSDVISNDVTHRGMRLRWYDVVAWQRRNVTTDVESQMEVPCAGVF